MKDETIDRLVSLLESVKQDHPRVKGPSWWRRKPSKKEIPRQSIRKWDEHPDWYRLANTCWAIGGWVCLLSEIRGLPYGDNFTRNDAQVAGWILGDYLKQIRNADLRDYVERMQQIAYAVVACIDEDESAVSTGDTAQE